MLLEISPQKSLNFSKSCPKAPQGKSKVSFCSESCSKVVEKNCTVVCADCLLPLVAVTEVIMASSNINKLSMMISSTTSLDHIYQKLLSCLRKRGWCTLAWYFQALFSPPPPPRGGGGETALRCAKHEILDFEPFRQTNDMLENARRTHVRGHSDRSTVM